MATEGAALRQLPPKPAPNKARYRHTKPQTPQANGTVERFNGRIASEVLDINIHLHRALEQLPRGFNQA